MAFQKDLPGKTYRNKGDVVLCSRLDTTWYSPICCADQIQAM